MNQWCSDMDGKTVTKAPGGVDTAFAFYDYSYYSYWLSATNWYFAPGENGCGDTATITKAECIDALTYAMITCDPNSGDSHGASYVGTCISYVSILLSPNYLLLVSLTSFFPQNITLDGQASPQSPPWNRQPASETGLCDQTKASTVTNAFWKGVYPQFCSQVDQNPTAALTKDLTQKDFVNPSTRKLRLRTPPPSSGSYPPKYGNDWTFHFEFTGANGDCSQNCGDALYALATSPCECSSFSFLSSFLFNQNPTTSLLN